MKSQVGLAILLTFAVCLRPVTAPAADAGGKKISFKKAQLDDKFRSEGVAVGDFNRDGKMDIAAGFVWYAAPDWEMHVIAADAPAPNSALRGSPPHYDPKGYSNSFCNFAEDLNGDGWTDLIVVDFPGKPTWWFENPGDASKPWPRHVVTPVTNNESPDLLDLDGNGQRELVAGFSPDAAQPDGLDRQVGFMTRAGDPEKVWKIHAVSTKASPGSRKYSHGLGAGDLNGDGRKDILCADGWWEAPAAYRDGAWNFHTAPFGERGARGEGKAAHLYVYDFDGDGDNDVLSSSPHAFGIWWHEQLPGDTWKTHEIDTSFSQAHAVCFVDMNGDDLPDFVTGKRWWAHGGRDPGGDQPAVMFWFELQRENGKVNWVRHPFDHNSGIGTQFQVIDVNGDDLLDVVTANKRGVFYFEQVRE
ncbi:MAG: FG-GAP repeat domain-containing protein [Pirellulaceae bacterium]